MRRTARAALAALLMAAGAPAGAASPEAQALLDAAAEDCARMDGGAFSAEGAVTEIEFRSRGGRAQAAELVDEGGFRCSTVPGSLWCGTGGCLLNIVVDGEVLARQATGWRMETWGGDRFLLLGLDGGWCGGSGAEVCYEAIVWSEGRLLTVGPALMPR